MSFTKAHAEATAKKLTVKPVSNALPRLEVVTLKDGCHIQQRIFCQGVEIARFGIKHGSKRNASHGWVARRLGLSPRQMMDFAICQMSVDEIIQHFIDEGFLPAGRERRLPPPK